MLGRARHLEGARARRAHTRERGRGWRERSLGRSDTMNASELAAIHRAGGVRKFIAAVDRALMGVDSAVGSGFDVMPLSAADRAQSQSPQSTPSVERAAQEPKASETAPASILGIMGYRGAFACLIVLFGPWFLSLVSVNVRVGLGCFVYGLVAGTSGGRAATHSASQSCTTTTAAAAAAPTTTEVHSWFVTNSPPSSPAGASVPLRETPSALVTAERYAAAVATARDLSGVSNAERLKLYALFKQVESGDAPVKGPSRFNAVAFAKWQEWHAQRGLTADDARVRYVETVERLARR